MAKILIVDDDPFILDMYTLKLKEAGFTVENANNGQEGLAKIKKLKPDLLLLDLVMPEMDGFETLERLNKDAPFKPHKIVILTNLGQKEEVERGLKLGANDYIIKAHFTPSEVVEKVKKLLVK